MLRAMAVARRYRTTQALSPTSFELVPGQRLGLLGPNGAGKTTLLSILACELAPTEGRVVLDGHPVLSHDDARAARRSIGFLPQNPQYVPSFTASAAVEYAAWLKGVPSRQRKRAVLSVLDQVGLSDVAGKRMKTLSGGMIQRVGLACALVASPRILLLDEPTVGLDPAQRLRFRELVAGLEDVAVVLSTHLVEDVAVLATDILVLDRGEVRFRGTPTALASVGGPGDAGDSPLERGYMNVLGASDVAGAAR